jgi:uncharacterized damage-inducible protein DinB
MSLAQQALAELRSAHEFFNRSTRKLTEAQSTYAPAEGMMTAAQQVAHVAHTIEWFVEGAFRPEGFDQNWDKHAKVVAAHDSLERARAWFEQAIAIAREKVVSLSDAELLVPLPEGPIMGGVPRFAIFSAITDHTAHHRGALTVYARLNGIVPSMPYMDMSAAGPGDIGTAGATRR